MGRDCHRAGAGPTAINAVRVNRAIAYQQLFFLIPDCAIACFEETFTQMRPTVILFIAATFASGCASRQPTARATASIDQGNTPAASAAPAPIHRLPFTGRLVEGYRDELPPALAGSLADNSPVTFAYREQLSHDEYHIPLIVSALDPVTYVGAPLGDFGVTAFATLTICDGDAVLGDYTAKAFVSRPYTLYSGPTHREVEDAARAAVRAKIDDKLARDADRLAQEVKQPSETAPGPQ
jgi:hypothetical protein